MACKFWERIDTGIGECRKQAPKPRNDQNDRPNYRYVVWPLTNEHDWCGEHDHKHEHEEGKS